MEALIYFSVFKDANIRNYLNVSLKKFGKWTTLVE